MGDTLNVLTLFFLGITRLGSELFYFAFVPLLYWCIDRELGVKVGILISVSTYVSSLLKAIFKVPRPPEALHKIEVEGYGFPSTHALNAASLWGYFSLKLRQYSTFFLLFLVLIPLIAFSRIYLGVHYLRDVTVGGGIGIVVLGVFLAGERFANTSKRKGIFTYLLLLTVPLALIPSDKAAMTMGTLLGLGGGYLLEKKRKGLDMNASLLQRSLRLIIGFPLLLLTFFPLNAHAPDLLPFIFLTYSIFGLLTTFLIPELLKHIERLIW